MRIFSESPLDRRDHTNRLSCHIIHEFRFSRIDFCSAARCRQRAGESGSYDPPRAFTGISRVHSTATVARTVPLLGASRESSSPAHRLSPGCAPPPVRPNPPSEGSAPRQRAGENDFYDPPRDFTGIFRVHSTATIARTVPSLGASYCTRIFVSRASAFARLRAAASARAKAAPTTHFVPSR